MTSNVSLRIFLILSRARRLVRDFSGWLGGEAAFTVPDAALLGVKRTLTTVRIGPPSSGLSYKSQGNMQG